MSKLLKVLKSIKSGGKYYAPGSLLGVEDEKEQERLVKLKVAEYLPSAEELSAAAVEATEAAKIASDNAVKKEEIIDELSQVKGVGKKMALEMVSKGIKGIASLQKMDVVQLMDLKLKGLNPKKAQAILNDAAEFTSED